ncbi:ABC transporter permease [Candidatus Peregrinibacteria bacterium]|nr:ABC transporter permease [Candidatus Peregrinibacteria bacterium]
MKLKNTIQTAFHGLRRNTSRSLLTVLGIVIGITAIILVMSVGKGAQNLILDQIRGLGSQTIIIGPGQEPKGPSSYAELFTDSLKEKDITALKKPSNVRGIRDLTPNVEQIATVSYEQETMRTNIIGTSELLSKILEVFPNEGTFLSDNDVKQKAKVAVIGSEVKKELFGPSNALGKKIKIKGKTFEIIGVLLAKGRVSFLDVDHMVAIPYTTAQQYLLGINYFQNIIIRVESEDIIPRVVDEIKLTMRETHGIDDPSKDDFHVMTQADAAERVSMITGILTILLMSVAAISLIVGGIGIMNIMLVTVSERTHEIGLRKAIGATEKDIMQQFLLEAMLLTAFGGLIGIGLGAFFALLTSVILTQIIGLNWSFAFPISASILGIGVSSTIGLIFGLYPAKRASRLSPIEALRYE